MGLVAVYPAKKLSVGNRPIKFILTCSGGSSSKRVNQVWQPDITYIPIEKGFMYMIAIIEVRAAIFLNRSVSNIMDAGWCVDVLKETVAPAWKAGEFNTDQRSQFTSDEFIKGLTDNQSMIFKWHGDRDHLHHQAQISILKKNNVKSDL